MNIKDTFNDVSQAYNKQRKKQIPCFDDYYNTALSLIKFDGTDPKVLDLGCGTGIFSAMVLKKFPNAKITFIDLSDKMLDVAKDYFGINNNFTYINDDYTSFNFKDKYDIVISGLSIHHLFNEKKEDLFKNIFTILNTDGIFINADQVLSEYEEMEITFKKLWKDYVENSGLTEDEINRTFERIKFDNPSTLNEQINWLKKAGFSIVDIIYKYYHFCVFYAKK